MRLKPRIVIHSPVTDPGKLKSFVAQCLQDGVRLIAAVGEGCVDLEEEIDWIAIGDGSKPARYITTSSHPTDSLEEVLEFAASWSCEGEEGVQQVRL